jgi:hypothetical protein
VRKSLMVLGLGLCSFFLTTRSAMADGSSSFTGVTAETQERYATRQIEKIIRINNVSLHGCKTLTLDEFEMCLRLEAFDPGSVYELVPRSIRVFPAPRRESADLGDVRRILLGQKKDETNIVTFQVIHDIGGKEGRIVQEALLYVVTSHAVEDKEDCSSQIGSNQCRMTCAHRNGTQAVAHVLGSPEGRFYALDTCYSLHMNPRDLDEPIVLAHALVPEDSYPRAPRKGPDGHAELNISTR